MTKKRKVNTHNGNGNNGGSDSNGNNYHKNNGGNNNGYKDLAPTYKLLREFKPKTKNQNGYVRAIAESDVVICHGPSGSGKTAVATAIACQYLVYGKVNKIIITRPIITVGKSLGALPGDILLKVQPYMVPIIDEMNIYFSEYEVQKMIAQNIIEIAPLEIIRGRNFHNSFVLLDEAQNATLEQIKMLITRIGNDSKVIVNGDLRQSDLGNGKLALQVCIDKLEGIDGVSIVKLTSEDIIRHPIISRILAKLEA